MVGVCDLHDVRVVDGLMSAVVQPAHLPAVDEEDLVPGGVDAPDLGLGAEPQAHRDASGIEQLLRKGDYAIHDHPVDEVLPDLIVAVGLRCEGAVGEDEACHPVVVEMIEEVLHPCEVGVPSRHSVHPTGIVLELVRTPFVLVERRIGHDEVRTEVLVEVPPERVVVMRAEIRGDPADGKVHLGELEGGESILLTVDGDVGLVAVMSLDELHRLDEHSS